MKEQCPECGEWSDVSPSANEFECNNEECGFSCDLTEL